MDRHGEAWDTADEEGRAYISELGRTVITLSDEENSNWEKAIQPILDDYVKAAEEKKSSRKAVSRRTAGIYFRSGF